MEIELDFTESAQENANALFEKAKKLKKKEEGARSTIEKLEKKLCEEQKEEQAKRNRPLLKELGKKEWYEKFHWFFTSNKFLAIGGRDARQNELLNSKYFDDGDLFLHADVYGASVVILKGGESADAKSREEAAQFAACYSRGWSSGINTLDVYALKRQQIKKSTNKGYLPTGSFAMSGEREWYKGMRLELVCFIADVEGARKLVVVPSKAFSSEGAKEYAVIKPGNAKKSDAAKLIAKILKFDDLNYIMQQLPSGEFDVSREIL